MKKLFIWTCCILGALALIFISAAGYFYLRLTVFGDYPSGGPISNAQSQYDVLFYDIRLSVDPDKQAVRGHTIVRLRLLSDTLSIIELDLLDNLEVSSVTDEQDASRNFTRDGHKLFVRIPPVKTGSITGLKIHYSGKPLKAFYPPWKGGFNWSKDIDGNPWIGLSCQGEGAKVWIPCKDHPSDEPDSAGIQITIPDHLYCASNGLLDSVTRHPDGQATYHWFTRYPINNYNINISIGNYRILTRNYITLQGDTMPVIFYVLPQNMSKADSLIDMAVDMLYAYRKYFGEYPFAREKFGLADNDYLGMEHQTLNAYGNQYNFDNILGHRFDGLMLHEMGHEWWGNSVTAKDWSDFWIHESFCTYGESLYHLEKTGETGYHEYMSRIRKQIKNSKSITEMRSMTTSESYHPDIYFKGAYMIHSFRHILGDSVFFPMIRTFASSQQYSNHYFVTAEDFMGLVHKASGRNWRPFIEMYLYTTEIPEINMRRISASRYEIKTLNTGFELPIDVRIGEDTRRYMIGPEAVVIVSDDMPEIDSQRWYLKNVNYGVEKK